jgi:hypothetical protein
VREYYSPSIESGKYEVVLDIESNSFFKLPKVSIAGSSIIKIEPNELNLIELDLIAD